MDTLRATCVDHGGKGRYLITRRGNKTYYRHRLVYVDHKGVSIESINGLVVRHRCDNSRCLNPEHLELGTQADNMEDMWKRTREGPHKKHYAAIRSEYVRGSKECGQKALAKKFNTSQTHIGRIINRKVAHDN